MQQAPDGEVEQYPRLDLIEEQSWVTAPGASEVGACGGSQWKPRRKTKIIPVVTHKVQPPGAAVAGKQQGKSGKGKGQTGAFNRGRGGRAKGSHGFRGNGQKPCFNQTRARKGGANGAGAKTAQVGGWKYISSSCLPRLPPRPVAPPAKEVFL